MARMASPIRPTDPEARDLARRLLDEATFGALGVLHPETGVPNVSRIAISRTVDGTPMTLISDLAPHTGALRADPRASLLLGEPEDKGDPLVHPRMTIACKAAFLEDKAVHRDHYLAQQPKAALYFDFADFHLVRFTILGASLNGGFGRAYELSPDDIL